MSNMRGVVHNLHCDCVNPTDIPDMRNVSRKEYEVLAKQVTEIHEFISGLAGALNSPIVKSMLPPHMRGMLGG